MPSTNPTSITVGEPNWAPLETVLTPQECEDFMYIGRAGQIELFKHVLTRRYLNISHDGRRFYRRERDEYIEISKTEALDYVRQ
jgi:hypothetical protein